jgi:hypothetical protein
MGAQAVHKLLASTAAAAAVAIAVASNPTAAGSANPTATWSSVAIGAADATRMVIATITWEANSRTPTGMTIDYGSGATAMNMVGTGQSGQSGARIFWLMVPTGTTATFVVTFNGNVGSQVKLLVYRAVTAASSLNSTNPSGNDDSLDMDATDPLTTGSITIPTGGAFFGVACGGTNTNAKSWANATEDFDAGITTHRCTTAIRTTAGTVTITCTGTSDGEDGQLAWIVLDPA